MGWPSSAAQGGLTMTEWGDPVVLTAGLSAATPLTVWAFGTIIGARRERQESARQEFAEAYMTLVEYLEFPFVVRRRDATNPPAERLRISADLHRVQARLAYHEAWIGTRSPRVGTAYSALIEAARKAAGGAMSVAWEGAPVSSDAEMNTNGLIDLSPVQPFKKIYLTAVHDHLSWQPRPLRSAARSIARRVRRNAGGT